MSIEDNLKRIDTVKSKIQQRIDKKLSPTKERLDKKLVDLGIKEPDLDTSYGLYDVAVKTGLKPEADKLLAAHTGEHPKEFWSGGFISDIFDTLNTLDYGVVGLLKGQSFNEGVRTRASFTDKDSFGDSGIPGIVFGLALDIAVDPLTYIAPLTVLNKIPGFTKGAKLSTEWTFGRQVVGEIAETAVSKGQKLTRLVEKREGGTKVGTYFAEKLKWGFGQDPIYKEIGQQKARNIGIASEKIIDVSKGLNKIPNKGIVDKLIMKDDIGQIVRKPIKQLQEELSPEDFKEVSEQITFFDTTLKEYGQEMVDLGLVDEGTFINNFDTYLSQRYMSFDDAEKAGFAFSKGGIKTGQKRLSKDELVKNYIAHLGDDAKKLYPEVFDSNGRMAIKNLEKTNPEKFTELAKKGREAMGAALGEIESPSYLFAKTLIGMKTDIESAKAFNAINKHFGSEVLQDGFKQLPKSSKFDTNKVKRIEKATEIKGLNKTINSELKKLKSTFKEDAKIVKEIDSLGKEVVKISDDLEDNLSRFVSSIGKSTEILKKTPRKLGIISEKLQPMANAIKKFDNYDDFIKTADGISLEKLDVSGDLQRNGFKSMEDFFDTVKNPFKKGEEKVVQDVADIKGSELVKLQTKVEKTREKLSKIKDIDKTSLNDSFIQLEKKINDLRFHKEDLVEDLGNLRLGNLAGKFVPESIFDDLTELSKVTDPNIGGKVMAAFKFGHVILNPATQVRNMLSNRILNWWKLGIGPWDVRLDAKVIKAMKQGADNSYIKMAKKEGWGLNTMVSQEFRALMDSQLETLKWGTGALSKAKKVGQKASDLYQGSENYAKLSAFIHHVDKGISPTEAWKAAESATFNYAEVTPAIRNLRTSLFGVPFITFTIKATPIALETALKAPHRISAIGKIKNTIENQADIKMTERERAAEAPWIKDGFYIKLPHKDSDGRSMYFDLTYILPFGDLASGDWFQRQVVKDTGTVEPWFVGATSKSPFINAVKELSRNQDFSGRSIWKSSGSTTEVGGDIMRYLLKTMMPPLIGEQIPGGYNDSGERVSSGFLKATSGDKKGTQQRNLMEEMLKTVGAKIQPIDADISESMQEWNMKKGLRTLLKDNFDKTNVKDFSTTYIPN